MTELSFAKSYLSLLDSRPIKLQADHVTPPQNLELTGPYTLPRMSGAPMKNPGASSTSPEPGANAPTLTITLKSSRNPSLSLSLPSTSTKTSILELKERVAKELAMKGTEKIRVLYQKKPCSDSKTVKEVVGDGSGEVEFGVMVMGYTASNLAPGATARDAAVADEGATMAEEAAKEKKEGAMDVLRDEGFWADLREWLVERLGDENVAGEVLEGFRRSAVGR